MSPVTFFRESRRVGFKRAWVNFSRRRHLPLIGYLILAGFIALAFAQERTHSNANRDALAMETHRVLVAGCERSNDQRALLRSLIAENIPAAKQYVKEGTLTQAQADRSIAASKDAMKRLTTVDCEKAYPLPKKSSDETY